MDKKTGFVFPCNSIKNTAWSLLKNFDHALILQEEDPLLPEILKVYEAQGIKDGAPTNTMKGPAFSTDLAKAYPECRLVVVKKVATCENLIEVFHDLLKDKYNITKMTFTSGGQRPPPPTSKTGFPQTPGTRCRGFAYVLSPLIQFAKDLPLA